MSTHNNTIPIVNGVDSTSEGDLLNLQEVTLFGNGITVSSGTDHMNITFTGSGYLEKLLTDDATSVTITCRAQSDAKYLTATILDNSETILSKRSIGYSAFPQKMVLTFSSGIGQVLRLEGTDAGVKLYNIHADAGLRTSGFKYLIFVAENGVVPVGGYQTGWLTELLINTDMGLIGNSDTSLVNVATRYDIQTLQSQSDGYGAPPGTVTELFDTTIPAEPSNNAYNGLMFSSNYTGALFSFELKDYIGSMSWFMYWCSNAAGGAGRVKGGALYGSAVDPSTFADPSDLTNYTKLADGLNKTNKSYTTEYDPTDTLYPDGT